MIPIIPSIHNTPTQACAAEHFGTQAGHMFAYDVHIGDWRVCIDGIWRVDDLGAARGVMKDFLRATREASDGEMRSLGTDGFLSGALSLSQIGRTVTSTMFDRDPMLLGVPGGYIDLRDGSMHAPDPSKMISRCTSVVPAPGDAPRWMKFLDQTFRGDQELIAYMQRVLGYCLTGKTNEEQFWFWHGSGGNGKGVMIRSLVGLMGDYAIVTPSSTFVIGKYEEHSTEIARMNGARLVMTTELPERATWNIDRIKTCSGNEGKIAARFMRQDFFEFEFTGKLVLVGNHKPTLTSVDDSITRRLRLVPFLNNVPEAERDEGLKDALREEYPQILQWMVDGLQIYQRKGLKQPTAVRAASSDYLNEQDVVSVFLDDECTPAADNRMTLKELRTIYSNWCHRSGFPAPQLSPQAFRAMLTSRGYTVARRDGQWCLLGFTHGSAGGTAPRTFDRLGALVDFKKPE